jgi:site-specific DNA recombinase
MKKITTIKASPLCDETGKQIKKLRVAAYCRVSTMHEEQQNSFDAQVRHYKSVIETNPDWIFAGIYADEGISGKTKKNRPEFLRMVRDAENRKLDLIITKSISRFARNTTDCIETVRLLKSWGVGVSFEKENINTFSAESELVLTILSSIAEEELASMSQNICWSNQQRFKQGKLHLVTERFMGYDRDGKGGLVINEDQAAVVRRVFNACISGLGISRIARGLEADGVKNVSGGTSWQPSVILRMLKNEKYVGDAILQKTVTSNSITFKRKPNEGEAPMYYIRDNHPPIIDREKFESVQALLKDRAQGKGYSPEMAWKYQIRYPFSQKIVCGNCGRSFRHLVRNSSYPSRQYYWGCANYIERKMSTCDMGAVKNNTLERLFIRVFNKLLLNRKILASFAATLRTVNSAKIGNGQLKEVDAEIEALLKQEHTLLKLYEDGVADKAMLRIEHEELIGKLGQLRANRSTMIQQIEGQDNRLKRTEELIALFAARDNPIETFDEELFAAIVDRLIVRERECIVFCLKNGMELEERYKFQRGDDKV